MQTQIINFFHSNSYYRSRRWHGSRKSTYSLRSFWITQTSGGGGGLSSFSLKILFILFVLPLNVTFMPKSYNFVEFDILWSCMECPIIFWHWQVNPVSTVFYWIRQHQCVNVCELNINQKLYILRFKIKSWFECRIDLFLLWDP